PSPRVMTMSPRRVVVPPRISSSAWEAVSGIFLLACSPVGPLACFLTNVGSRSRERLRDRRVDAAIGEDHLRNAFVDRLDGAQHHAASIDADAQRVFARAFEDTAVEAREAHGVDAFGLQLLDPHLVQLAAVDHLEDLERAPIGSPADVPGLAGYELRRMPERFRDGIGGLRAAMHEQELSAFAAKRHDVRNDGVN